MIKLLIILMIPCKIFGQDYVLKWKTIAKEPGVINYQQQRSKDSLGVYSTIKTLPAKKLADSNIYSFVLPPFTENYYRLKILLFNGVIFTTPFKIVNTNVSITNAVLKINTASDNLSFSASGEALVDYYLIERSNNDGGTWAISGKLTQKNLGRYIVNISKSGTNRKYRLSAIYKSGIKSGYINFT